MNRNSILTTCISTVFATVLLLSQSAFADTNTLRKNDQTFRLTNTDYQLVDVNLDAKRFSAKSMLVSLHNVTKNALQLNIMNNICPKVPGKPSCLAMPYPLFTGEFKLGKAKVDNCGVITQKSSFIYKTDFQNKTERAQLIVRDYRYMTCEIMAQSQIALELNLKSENEKSQSVILLNTVEVTNMPVLMPFPPPLKHPTAVQNFTSQSVVDASGSFFQNPLTNATELKAELSLDQKNKQMTIEVQSLDPACGILPCAAVNSLVSKTLDIQSVKSNKCGERTYFSSEESVYDFYPTVVGAIHTYVRVELVDSRYSLCGGSRSVTAHVIVNDRQNLTGTDEVVSESSASFEMSQIEN